MNTRIKHASRDGGAASRTMPLVFLLSVIWLFAPATTLANELANHPSPYLAMHGEDPVEWREWGTKVLAQARKEQRLLFVSSGYFTCYWCHVLHRESFSDADTAKILNVFLPVKVDRELRPALDSMLIDFVSRTRGRAGWPLNVIMTPDGYPLIGFTYLPPEQFRSVLENITREWNRDAKSLSDAARDGFEAMRTLPRDAADVAVPEHPGDVLMQVWLHQTLRIADEVSGGFGAQNKFPQPARMMALLASYEARPVRPMQDFITLTLDAMADNGLRDHIGGGFFRYSTDPHWQVPHFEKMLYTNALVASLYLQAADVLGRPDYRAVAFDTLDFMINELQTADGAMIAALSSVDSKGEEGGYYVWQADELDSLLGKSDATIARQVWQMDGHPQTEIGYLPMRGKTDAEIAVALQREPGDIGAVRERARARLLDARRSRGLPRDDKQLAGWNGLALSALARATGSPDGGRYREAGQRMRDYLVKTLWDGEQLHRAIKAQRSLGEAALDDYAFVAQGLLDWSEAVGSADDRDLAQHLSERAWVLFHNPKGWRLAVQDILPYDLREPLLDDGALVSPAAVLIGVSLRLDSDGLRQKAVSNLQQTYGALMQSIYGNAAQMVVLLRYQDLITETRSGSGVAH